MFIAIHNISIKLELLDILEGLYIKIEQYIKR